MLRLEQVHKFYGEKKALLPVSLTLGPGIHALLGPNGAGKSTLMNVLSGTLRVTGGEAYWNDVPCGIMQQKKELPYLGELGYLPQRFGCYDAFSGMDMLQYFAALKGLAPGAELEEQIRQYVEWMELTEDIHRKIRTYSGGMRQRIGIIQAFLGKPKFLILDEPTAGLDPKQRLRFKRMVEAVAEDCIVLLSTHILSDVQELADTVLILKEGEILDHVAKGSDVEAVYMNYFREDGDPE